MKTPLQTIPGVGKNMAGHLEALGVTCVEEMVGKDPEALYTLDQARFPVRSWTGAVSMCTAWRWLLRREGRTLRKSRSGGITKIKKFPGGRFRRGILCFTHQPTTFSPFTRTAVIVELLTMGSPFTMTTSPSLPTSKEPTRSAMPKCLAGLMVMA